MKSSQTIISEHISLLRFAFDKYVDRCEEVLIEFFDVKGSRLVDFRAWIYDCVESAESIADAMADTMHTEPLYVAAEFLGVDVTSEEFRTKEALYPGFAYRNSVQHRAA